MVQAWDPQVRLVLARGRVSCEICQLLSSGIPHLEVSTVVPKNSAVTETEQYKSDPGGGAWGGVGS